MKMKQKLCLAVMLVALVAGVAEAKGKPGSGGGGGVPTNYGCMTFAAGKVLTSPTGTTTKTLLTSTYTCYLCNMTTHLCVIQSPSTLYGWTFYY
jgi:hypothetical protein